MKIYATLIINPKCYCVLRIILNYTAICAVSQAPLVLHSKRKGRCHMKPRQVQLGDKNIVGDKVYELRTKRNIKQKDFLSQLQVLGMDISATGLSRLEGQHRLVQDFEVVFLAQALHITVNELLKV